MEALNKELLVYWKETTGAVIRSIEPFIVDVPEKERLSFTWHIYRSRPQICYSLASRIMHEIYFGCYKYGQFLPSYGKMAEEYDVSPNTIRRTIRILAHLGVVRTMNGKGTRIYSIGEHIDQPDYAFPAVRRNLALFYQSFELLYYTCEIFADTVLSSLSKEDISELNEHLQEYIRIDCCEVTLFRLLLHLSKLAPLQGLREIYANVYFLFLWGYPLKASADVSLEFENIDARFAKNLIQHLKDNDIEQCISTMKEYISLKFRETERCLLRLGLSQEELLLPPSLQVPIRQ